MGKYTPLANFLSSLDRQRWQLTFAEVEAILGFPLPQSAYRYPAWWANDSTGHSHAAAWLDAGWKTEDVDVPRRRLTLVRQIAPAPGGNKFGCMKGTAWLAPDTDLTAPSNGTFLAEDGKLLSE